jgi:hypothetical protein
MLLEINYDLRALPITKMYFTSTSQISPCEYKVHSLKFQFIYIRNCSTNKLTGIQHAGPCPQGPPLKANWGLCLRVDAERPTLYAAKDLYNESYIMYEYVLL